MLRSVSAAAAAKSLQSCPTLCDPIDGSPPGSLSPGFSRQEHWSGLPFPSPMHESEKKSEVAQSCPTPSDPMDCSPPGPSIHGIFQTRVLEWVAITIYEKFSFSTCSSEFDIITSFYYLSYSNRCIAASCHGLNLHFFHG